MWNVLLVRSLKGITALVVMPTRGEQYNTLFVLRGFHQVGESYRPIWDDCQKEPSWLKPDAENFLREALAETHLLDGSKPPRVLPGAAIPPSFGAGVSHESATAV